ncbi:hypothetical protein BASA61_006964 [Batrachochytrium salamandrivorans]|nr:hypothetical protein BASA61_006964 [Batrachochytrium salamandrivorans]KAJ1332382.1 hypothetical protein BSLG_008686 [Batrachochytrium salamandrivorans]
MDVDCIGEVVDATTATAALGSAGATVDVVASAASSSGLSIILHPLVILNISDQHTRIKMQSLSESGISHPRVLGALVGIQTGRDIEILNSFELPFHEIDTQPTIDMVYFNFKQDQYKQVYPTMDFLGWYSTGISPTPEDIHIHQQMCQQNEAPLFLQMLVKSDESARETATTDLPITVYESMMEIVAGVPQTLFVKSQFKIETNDAELLAIEHVAHETSSDNNSKLVAHLVGKQNAIRMLQSRVRTLATYMNNVEKGILPKDHTLLRQISSLCNRLPTIQGIDFDSEFNVDYNDVLLMTLLASITKGTHTLNELLDKTSSNKPKRSTRGSGVRVGSMGTSFGNVGGHVMHI